MVNLAAGPYGVRRTKNIGNIGIYHLCVFCVSAGFVSYIFTAFHVEVKGWADIYESHSFGICVEVLMVKTMMWSAWVLSDISLCAAQLIMEHI